jgi:hypothetical protein
LWIFSETKAEMAVHAPAGCLWKNRVLLLEEIFIAAFKAGNYESILKHLIKTA